jgi:hypothetical protein
MACPQLSGTCHVRVRVRVRVKVRVRVTFMLVSIGKLET